MGVGLITVLTAVLSTVVVALSGAIFVLERRSAPVPLLTLASGVACVALLILAGSSLMQLGRPQLIFAAFSNPSSSIFRMGVAWVMSMIALGAYLVAVHRAAYELTCRRLAFIVFVACMLVLGAHTSNYVMPWRAAWNTWSIVLPFFGFAALGAVAVKGLVDSIEGLFLEKRFILEALIFSILSLVLYLGIIGISVTEEPTASRALIGDLAWLFWGLVVIGLVVPSLLMLIFRRNKSVFVLSLLAILAGSAGWQIMVLKLGAATWSFFAR